MPSLTFGGRELVCAQWLSIACAQHTCICKATAVDHDRLGVKLQACTRLFSATSAGILTLLDPGMLKLWQAFTSCETVADKLWPIPEFGQPTLICNKRIPNQTEVFHYCLTLQSNSTKCLVSLPFEVVTGARCDGWREAAASVVCMPTVQSSSLLKSEGVMVASWRHTSE